MDAPLAAESALRWILTYSLHSAVLGAIGLVAARILLGPGSRRAVVLKVALFGALLSASLPWKAIAPLRFASQVGAAMADRSAEVAQSATPTSMAAVPDARVAAAGPPDGDALSGAPDAAARTMAGLGGLGSRAPWWMTLMGGISVLLVSRMVLQRRRFLRILGRRPLRDLESERLLAGWSLGAGMPVVALTVSTHLRHLLDGDERPAGRRFGAGAALALVGFACCSPAVTTMNGSSEAAASTAFTGAIEIVVAENGMADARRSADYPAMEPIQVDLSTRAGKERLQAWLGTAAAALEPWSVEKMEAAGLSRGLPFQIREGALVIRGEDDVQLKYALWIMGMAGSQDVQMPDVRLRIDRVVYPVPLPLDIGLSGVTSVQALEVRIDAKDPADPRQGFTYTLTSSDRPAGMPPEEELLEDEEVEVLVDLSTPKVSTSVEGLVTTAGSLIETGKTLEATVDGRKGVRLGTTAAVLKALDELGIERVTFKGTFEQ